MRHHIPRALRLNDDVPSTAGRVFLGYTSSSFLFAWLALWLRVRLLHRCVDQPVVMQPIAKRRGPPSPSYNMTINANQIFGLENPLRSSPIPTLRQ
jgi:hypothetical protein